MRRRDIVWAMLVAQGVAQAQFPLLRSLEVRSGQRRPQITQLVQDDLGLIWTGSDVGVIRTDGERVEVMIRADSASVSAMQAAGPDVHVAFSSGALVRCSGSICDTLLNDVLLKTAPIRAIARADDGTLCLATYGAGVWLLRNGSVRVLSFAEGMPDDHVNDVAYLDTDRFVAATDQGLAVLTSNGVSAVFDGASGAPDNLVMAVATMPDGSVVAGTEGTGVFRWRPGTREALPIGRAWSLGAVTDIVVEQQRIWIGTASNGVVVHEMDDAADIYHRSATSGAITGFWSDPDGTVWWCDGTEHIHHADPAILFVTEHEGMDLRDVSAICVDPMDRIWLASPSGLFHHPQSFPGGRHLERVDLMVDPRTPIVSLTAAANGTVWAATFGSGVLAIDPSGDVHHFRAADGLRNENVLAARASGDTIWFATLDGICLWDGSRFVDVEGSTGFTFDVLPIPGDGVYIASDGQGIMHRKEGSTTRLQTAGRTFYSLVPDETGDGVWAMGPDAGLCRVEEAQVVCAGAGLPLFNDDLFALATVHGRVLVLGKAGVWAHDPASGRWMDLADRTGTVGVEAELNAITRSRDGAVWFACDRGLVRLRLTERHFTTHIPLVVTGIYVNRDPVPLADTITTNHDRNDITLRFAGVYYPDPGSVRFEYSIGEKGDVLRSRDRELAFTGLAPGVHRIRIRAFLDGSSGDPEWRILTVIVNPPWWRMPWVVALGVLCVLGLLILVVRGRERRMRYRERMEQEKVRFQLEALRSQVDPHFLFNSFNTLAALIETDPDKAVHHVDEMSTFFRSILLVRDKDLIPLSEELELLQRYFDLEKHRFGAAIDLLVRIDEEIDAFRIVPLTLQLLMENALKHNVATDAEPLQVLLTIERSDVVMRNAVRPRASAARSTGFGLESIIKRYAAIGPRPVVVEADAAFFVVRVPLIEA